MKSDLSEDQHKQILPDLTDYPKRLKQLNDLFASGEPSWDGMDREGLLYYLTTMLLWHESEHNPADRVWTGRRIVIKQGWMGAGRTGMALGEPVFVLQLWLPVHWDGEDDPDFHKLAGMELG